eukprot:SAG11_NODE_4841_length_1749_cov_1.584242_1_plen_170_part_00
MLPTLLKSRRISEAAAATNTIATAVAAAATAATTTEAGRTSIRTMRKRTIVWAPIPAHRTIQLEELFVHSNNHSKRSEPKIQCFSHKPKLTPFRRTFPTNLNSLARLSRGFGLLLGRFFGLLVFRTGHGAKRHACFLARLRQSPTTPCHPVGDRNNLNVARERHDFAEP